VTTINGLVEHHAHRGSVFLMGFDDPSTQPPCSPSTLCQLTGSIHHCQSTGISYIEVSDECSDGFTILSQQNQNGEYQLLAVKLSTGIHSGHFRSSKRHADGSLRLARYDFLLVFYSEVQV